jgi:head-tail adaptor
MSFHDRLFQTLVIERAGPVMAPAGLLALLTPVFDDYNQPEQTWATLATVPGLIQPKSVKEMALVSQEGAVIANHTIYLEVIDVTPADRVKLSPDDGRIFEVTGVRNLMGHHLELDCLAVT